MSLLTEQRKPLPTQTHRTFHHPIVPRRSVAIAKNCIGYKNQPCPSHCIQRRRTRGKIYTYCYPIRGQADDDTTPDPTSQADNDIKPYVNERRRPVLFTNQLRHRQHRRLPHSPSLYTSTLSRNSHIGMYRPRLLRSPPLYTNTLPRTRSHNPPFSRYNSHTQYISPPRVNIYRPTKRVVPTTAAELVVIRKRSRQTTPPHPPPNTAYPRTYTYIARAKRAGAIKTDADEVARIVSDPALTIGSKISGVCKALGTNAITQVNGWLTSNWKPILFGNFVFSSSQRAPESSPAGW